MKDKSSRLKVGGILVAVVLIAYNVILFTLASGDEHGATFWISYVFMLIAFVASALCAAILTGRENVPRDWLLSYPFYKHCAFYLISEFIISIIFMLLDSVELAWQLPFVIQVILMVIFVVFIGSCFMAKEIIENVQKMQKVNTAFMKTLLVDVNMLVAKAQDTEVKNAFEEFADQLRYSDPVSSEASRHEEEEISNQVQKANTCLICNDKDGALQCCKKAMLLLLERNQKCKLMK